MSLGHNVVPIDLGDALAFDVDCAFICSPTQLHCEQALRYLEKKIPVFIEKPLTYSLEELLKFAQNASGFDVVNMVGCNMRFHPAIRDAKTITERRKVLFARAEFGYYLPFWRKGDYTKSYSAGEYGGIVIDDIHEIDYLFWLFGEINKMNLVCDKVSDLQIKCEDIAEIGILFKNGVSASVHQDYLAKNYHRRLTLHFGRDIMTFDILPTNLMYKKEVEYFISCVARDEMPTNNIMEATYVLEKIFTAKKDSGYNPSPSNINKTSAENNEGHLRKADDRKGN